MVKVCYGCEQVLEKCDDDQYGKYCLKAVYKLFKMNKNKEPLVDKDVRDCCIVSYNEIRRVTMFDTYAFYDNREYPLPPCMEDGTLKRSLSLFHNLTLANEIRRENNNGANDYYKAMQDHNA